MNTPEAVRTRSNSKETELVSDAVPHTEQLNSDRIAMETASVECVLTCKAEIFSLCSHDVKY
jgi:hypothetical protein